MLWLILSAVVAALDRITKLAICANLELGEIIPIIKSFFNITYIENTGAAWGIMSGNRIVLIVVSVAIAAVMAVFFVKIKSNFFRAASALIIGGALGNLIDRIATGRVVDFLQFYIFGYQFPSFNVADIAVVIGAFMLAAYIIFFYEKDRKAPTDE